MQYNYVTPAKIKIDTKNHFSYTLRAQNQCLIIALQSYVFRQERTYAAGAEIHDLMRFSERDQRNRFLLNNLPSYNGCVK
jgi:hypothetical protein